MRTLFSQFSGLIGILAFVNRMLAGAPVEKALLSAAGAGLSIYVVLLLGDVIIQRILEQAAASVDSASTPAAASGPVEQTDRAEASIPEADTKAA